MEHMKNWRALLVEARCFWKINMVAIPRPLVRNSLFILVSIVVIFCIQDSVFTLLDAINDLYQFRVTETNPVVPQVNEGNTTKRELVLLQMLFRHGHRAPFMLYPTDPNSESSWQGGLAMLTKLGRLQHYVLGLHLQNRYKDFITTNPNEVEMSNSDNFRCQYGVYAFIAGLYAPTKEYSFTDEFRWQPIISKHQDTGGKYIFTRRVCNISDEESSAFKRSREAFKTRDSYQDLYNFWSLNSGRFINNWVLAADLGKTLACERDYNLTVPEWGLKYWEELRKQAAISYYFNFGTKLIQRYRIGPLLGYMIENINRKILNRLSEKRVIVYSAHGSNLASLLIALDQYNWLGPPHASTVVMELWKESDDYTIRWLYFNSSNPERSIDPPVIFNIPGCGGEFCPLGTFQDLIRPIIPDDWEAECMNQSMKNLFKPFETSMRVPLSSSATVDFHWIVTIVSVICIYMTGKD